MKKSLLDEIEKSRRRMHEVVDQSIDAFLLRVQGLDEKTDMSRVRFLSSDPGELKGKKPSAITFADGRTETVNTWRKLVKTVLEDCGSSSERCERLLQVKDSVFGRQRRVLGGDPSEMNVPLKITDSLYFEGFFDTEYLFKQLTLVLDLAGYDYSGIIIQLREQQEQAAEQEEGISGPSMSM